MAEHVIIGNGVAGTKAAETIRKLDANSKITLVGDEPYAFYYRPQLPEFVAGTIEENRLWGKKRDFYEKNNIISLFGKTVTAIRPDTNEVVLQDENSIKYDSLLIATGGHIEKRNYPGIELNGGVVQLKTIDDAKSIKEKVKSAESAVVVGEDFLTLSLAEALQGSGLSVTYLLRGNRLWPETMDEDASQILLLRLKEKGITIKQETDVKEVYVKNKLIHGVITTDDELIDCQILGIVDKLQPSIGFLHDSGVNTDTGVLVNNKMLTNFDNIYAAGDVAQLPADQEDSETPEINIRWLKAWRQGQVAGSNMAGKNAEYDDVASISATQICGIDIVSVGISNPLNGDYRIMRGDYPHPEIDIYKKLVLKNDRVVGALFIGNAQEANEITKAIKTKKKYSEIDKTLLKQMFDLNYRFSSFRGILCPVCKLELPIPPDAKVGDAITCPACGIELKVTENMLNK